MLTDYIDRIPANGGGRDRGGEGQPDEDTWRGQVTSLFEGTFKVLLRGSPRKALVRRSGLKESGFFEGRRLRGSWVGGNVLEHKVGCLCLPRSHRISCLNLYFLD